MNPPQMIELTDHEQALYDSIQWEGNEWLKWDYDIRIQMLENVGILAESLIQRDAIPQVRLDYFVLPERNIGGHGKSRKQVFEGNGTRGSDILRHPHFMPYLWYFIHGPKLPQTTIDGFCQIIEEDRGTSGEVLDEICKYVRAEVRSRSLPHDAPDQFMKLAFEIGRPMMAENVRSAAKSVRK
jgi:hypothetical protein